MNENETPKAPEHKKRDYKEGYCEECENFDRLMLSGDSRYLCEECRDELEEIKEEESQEPDE